MYIVIKQIHSYLAAVLLLLLLIASIYALVGWLKQNEFSGKSKGVLLIGLIATHIQLIMGIIIYFISPLGISNFSKEIMANSIGRLYALEHPLMMLIGVVLITIGYSKSKRAEGDRSKFRIAGIFYTIGLVAILSRVPWHVWM